MKHNLKFEDKSEFVYMECRHIPGNFCRRREESRLKLAEISIF